MTAVSDVIEKVAARLAAINGIAAVVLGGSRARGTASPESDIDFGLYYDPRRLPDVAALRVLAHELDDRHAPEAITDTGEWGPWINGGGWMQIEGYRVDWLYRDLALVRRTLRQCRAGVHTCDYQPGHPHGFHNHIYMAELHHCVLLADASGTVARLKERTTPYPPRLKRVVIERHLFEAPFSLMVAGKAAARADASYVAGCLFRCVACLVQALFALNEQYLMNEKGSVALAETFPQRPENLARVVNEVLAQPGATPEEMTASIVRLTGLVQECQRLCAPALEELPPLPAKARTRRHTSPRK